MKNGHGEMVASVANLVTEALLESLPDSIREKVERAVAGVAAEVSQVAQAQAELVKKLEAVQLLVDEANARYGDVRSEVLRATQAAESLPAGMRQHAERAVADVANQLGAIERGQGELAQRIASLHGEIEEAQKRYRAMHEELARATHAYESTLEQIRAAVPLAIEGGLRAAVAALPRAADGKDGKDGERGPQGTPGHDAVFTRPIPWTKGRTYSRDTIVQARAGVWIAETETDQAPGAACSGWALIQDGVEPVRGELDEKGFATMVYRTASGREYSIALGYRPSQYAGIYDERRTYQLNDEITDNGGIWRALAETTGQRPGTPDTGHLWRLIQKRPKDGRDGTPGRDGRDGRDGVGERGPAGVSVLNVELSAGGLLETTLSDGRVLTLLTPFTTNKRRAAERERP